MAFQHSEVLRAWLLARAASLRTLAAAHTAIGAVAGAGRPPSIGRPLAHAYISAVLTEFQAFVRDLRDLAVAAPPSWFGAAADRHDDPRASDRWR